MRTLTFLAIAVMSMWAADAFGQQPSNQNQSDQEQTQDKNHVDGENGKQGRRNRKEQGQSQRRGKGQGQNKGQGQGQRKGKDQQSKQGEGQGMRQRGGPQMIEMILNRFDTDKNGSISIEEAPERMKQRFQRLDSNADNSVSKEELQVAMDKINGGRGKGAKDGKGEQGAKGRGAKGKGEKGKGGNGKGERGAKGDKGGEGKGRSGQPVDPAMMLKKVDANNDGEISLEEAPERMKDKFDRIDTDGNGTVSAGELKASLEKMKNRGKDGQVGRDKSANPEDKLPVKPKRPPMEDENGA